MARLGGPGFEHGRQCLVMYSENRDDLAEWNGAVIDGAAHEPVSFAGELADSPGVVTGEEADDIVAPYR